jgi:hypothetical protein
MKNEITAFAGKWMEPEITLRDSLAKFRKANSVCFPSYAESKSINTTKQKFSNLNGGLFWRGDFAGEEDKEW